MAAQVAPSDDDPTPLSDAEQAEKERLLDSGYSHWNRRDFNAFVRACERYGREALEDIAREVEGKTVEEVEEYSRVFWRNYKQLNDWERIIKNIERGEQRIQRQQDILQALASKLERYRNPWQELRIQYGQNKGKAYTGASPYLLRPSLLLFFSFDTLPCRQLDSVSVATVALHRQAIVCE